MSRPRTLVQYGRPTKVPPVTPVRLTLKEEESEITIDSPKGKVKLFIHTDSDGFPCIGIQAEPVDENAHQLCVESFYDGAGGPVEKAKRGAAYNLVKGKLHVTFADLQRDSK